MTLGKWILWIGFFCTTFNVLGQELGSFKHLSKEAGLSQVSVFAVAQDHAGFMWFGTKNGLNRFDGYQFKVYKKDTSKHSLVADDVRNLYADPLSDDLWIGTNYGVSKYKPNTDKFTNYVHQLNDQNTIYSDIVRRTFRDSKGRLWLGTSKGLNLYNDAEDHFKRILLTKKPNQKNRPVEVWIIMEDTDQQLWVGTNHGLFKLVEENGPDFDFQRVDGPGGIVLSDQYIRSILEDEKGNFWIGTDHSGINYWDRSSGMVEVYQNDEDDSTSLSDNQVRAMDLDLDNNLWVGTFNGLSFLKNGATTFKVYKKDKLSNAGISDNSIHSLFFDKRGSLWVGTFYGGVNHLDENYNRFKNFKHLPSKNSLSADVVSSFTEDSNGDLWIGTEGGGLNFYDQEKDAFEYYQLQTGGNNGLKSNNVKKLLLDGENLWIGTFQGGLSLFDIKEKTFQHFQNDPQNLNSLSGNNVYGLYKEDDKLWVLTYGKGLNVLDLKENKFHRFRINPNDKNSISSDLVRTFLATQDQQYWIGTEKGLNKVIKDPVGLPLRFETLLPEERVYVLEESLEQKIWVGTFSNGLFYLNPSNGTMEHFTMVDGLPGNSIFGIIEVSDQELWLSTDNGLSKFDYTKKTFTNYDHSNGLANLEYNFNAYYKTRSGALLFGGINGFTLFHPEDIVPNKYIPPVVITELRQNNQVLNILAQTNFAGTSTKAMKPIKFNYNQANFTINFAALDYISPENNRYAYKLEGLDRDWNLSTGKNEASYTIQRDGEYTFRVKGANSDGVWNPEEQLLKIVVLPPPWRTWWAYLIYVVVLGVLIYGLVRYVRLRHKLQLQQLAKHKQEELHELKLKFFTNITHEFRTPLTLILGPLKELIRKEQHSEHVAKKLHSIESNTQRLLNLVNQVLTFRKLATDHEPMRAIQGNLIDFLKEIFLSFQETAERRSISYDFKVEQEEIIAWYDADKLEKVFFNLLSNAFKFTSDGGQIEMAVQQKEKHIEIKVVDNGIGIESGLQEQIFKRFYNKPISNRSSIKGTGIGLAISKQMVELHQGEIFVQAPSQDPVLQNGATFVVQIPLGYTHLKQEHILHRFPEGEQVESYQQIKKAQVELPVSTILKNGKQASLLIVEDNAEISAYIQQVFTDQYQILTAEDGIEGLEKAKKHLPQLIISDVMMPRMDGITFCNKLKKDFEISHIPIILLTARTASIFKIEGLKTGADDYVTKPFDPEELRLRARNIIQTRQEIRDKFSRVLTFNPKEISITSADEEFLENALKIAEENIENYEFNVVQFAKDLAVSRPLLFTKLKALTGQTPNNFVKTIRLKRAAQLLKTQKLNVSEVAYKVGFKDPKYFRKCFKEQFKEVPSEYGKDLSV